MQIALVILEDTESGSRFSRSVILSNDDYINLKKALKDIFDFNQTLELFRILLLNEDSINNFIEKSRQEIISKSTRWNGVSNSDKERLKIELNKTLLNYLASARMYVDHARTFLIRKFGEASSQFMRYEKIRTDIYDNNFSYRFFYKLRDYIQHCGLPFETFGFRINAQRQVIIDISFDRDLLLTNFNSSWKSKVKNDLASQPKKIAFTPLLTMATENIKEIHNNLKTINAEGIKHSVEYLNSLTRHLKTDSNKVCIFSDAETFEDGKLKKKFLIEEIPHSILDIVAKEIV